MTATPEMEMAGGESPAIGKSYQLSTVDSHNVTEADGARQEISVDGGLAVRQRIHFEPIGYWPELKPPYSNTGVKVHREFLGLDGVPAESVGYVIIDWLAGTLPPYAARHIVHTLSRAIGHKISRVNRGAGWEGFTQSEDLFVKLEGGEVVNVGMSAWGGESQRGRHYFSLNGHGCSIVRDWLPIMMMMKTDKARISRCDVALDLLDGQLPLAAANVAHSNGGFDIGGRRPQLREIANNNGSGNTLYIGSRGSGKLIRIYEKGKQLGDKLSKWIRYEVEIHGSNGRTIPPAIVCDPVRYLAGMLPWIAELFQLKAEKIPTIKAKAKLALAAVLANARLQLGKVIGWLHRRGVSGDKIVRTLARGGTPGRLQLIGVGDALIELGLLPRPAAPPTDAGRKAWRTEWLERRKRLRPVAKRPDSISQPADVIRVRRDAVPAPAPVPAPVAAPAPVLRPAPGYVPLAGAALEAWRVELAERRERQRAQVRAIKAELQRTEDARWCF